MALKSLSKTVTTAGTQVALATSTNASSIIIRAMENNGGAVYIGDSTVSNTTGKLSPRDSISWESDRNRGLLDLADIYVDSDVDGDGVDVWYVETEA